MAYMNPYSGTAFFEFLLVFFQRLWQLATGQISLNALASDELQVFVLTILSLSAGMVGCFLVLRRMTMLANALSHTILLGIVLVYYFMTYQAGSAETNHAQQGVFPIEWMLVASLAMGALTTFLTELLTKHAGLQEDASIGIVFTTLFALGVILVTLLTRNAHIGTEIVMGNVDAITYNDLKLVMIGLLINLFLFFIFYKEYLITTFDPGLAKALGTSSLFFSYLLMMQVSITAIGGFRAVGVLMVLAVITAPALMARLFTHNLKKMLLLSGAIGALSSLIGVALSRHMLSVYDLALSTGAVVVMVMGSLFFGTLAIQSLRLRIHQGKLLKSR